MRNQWRVRPNSLAGSTGIVPPHAPHLATCEVHQKVWLAVFAQQTGASFPFNFRVSRIVLAAIPSNHQG